VQRIALRSHDADLAASDFDALGERSETDAAIAASDPYPLAIGRSGLPYHDWRDGLLAVALKRGGRSLGFGMCLIPDRLEAGDAVLERRVIQISHARFRSRRKAA
jgi:hypothetical protein